MIGPKVYQSTIYSAFLFHFFYEFTLGVAFVSRNSLKYLRNSHTSLSIHLYLVTSFLFGFILFICSSHSSSSSLTFLMSVASLTRISSSVWTVFSWKDLQKQLHDQFQLIVKGNKGYQFQDIYYYMFYNHLHCYLNKFLKHKKLLALD